MRENHLIKQAYVRGLAARGLLRQYAMQKRANDEPYKVKSPEFAKQVGSVIDQADNKDSWQDYAMYGGIGAAGGGILGALIQAARKKDILPGALIGAGLGGAGGLGTRAALNALNTTGVLSNEKLQKAKDAVHGYIDPKEKKVVDYLNDPSNQDMIKNIAISGGVGAAGGGIIGALIQAARQKNILLGAGIGAGIGGVGGVGVGAAPYITNYIKKRKAEKEEKKKQDEYLAGVSKDSHNKYIELNTNNDYGRAGDGIEAGYAPDMILADAKKNLTPPYKVIDKLTTEGNMSKEEAEQIVENQYWQYYQNNTGPEQYKQHNR